MGLVLVAKAVGGLGVGVQAGGWDRGVRGQGGQPSTRSWSFRKTTQKAAYPREHRSKGLKVKEVKEGKPITHFQGPHGNMSAENHT